jgi:phosphoadenosine phosphosulfate reductase
MIIRENLLENYDIVEKSIERLKMYNREELPYYLAFSGGKDSCVIKALADMAKVNYKAYYSMTTIDPPPLVRFVIEKHKDVIITRPKTPFLIKMMEKNFYPTRKSRWCCDYLKESNETITQGEILITGIRWAESRSRGKRKMVESCYKRKKTILNPIIDWSDNDVWNFIKQYNIPYCDLYDKGYKRLGCLFCPMTSIKNREKEIKDFPEMAKAFQYVFKKMAEKRGTNNDLWKEYIYGQTINDDNSFGLFEND